MTKKILIIGSGSWGTALGNLIANNHHQVEIFSRNNNIINEINHHHSNNKFLTNIKLSENLRAISKINSKYNLVFIAVPSFSVKEVFKNFDKNSIDSDSIFVICSKGIDENSLKFFGELFKDYFDNDFAILSGPNFAIEVAEKKPTITSLACSNKKIFSIIQNVLDNNFFKSIYTDAIGCVEISGVLKNIMAIGCGIIDYFELGINAKSALIIKGLNEIKLLCKTLGFKEDLISPAGFGDIFLTCSSTKSRNFSLGIILAKAEKIPSNITYEGLNSVKLIIQIAKKHNLQLDLSELIFKIITTNCDSESIKKMISAIILL